MRTLLALALSCAVLASCGKSDSGGGSGGGGGTGGGSASSSSGDGGDTPQAVFDRAKAATQKKDWNEFYVCVDPAGRDEMTFMFVFMGGLSVMGDDKAKKDFEGLLKKHGVEEKKEGEPAIDMGDKAKMKEGIAKMFAGVKDRKALFNELAAFAMSHAEKQDEMMPAEATLKDVKEEGQKASGKVVKPDGKESDMQFVKADGRWYMAMDD